MTIRDGNWLELVGTAIILLSVFWRVFLADRIKEIADEGWKHELEHKIDLIFNVVSHHYRVDHPSRNAIASSTDVDSYTRDWQLAGQQTLVQRQSRAMVLITECGFIIGSALALTGKYLQFFGASV